MNICQKGTALSYDGILELINEHLNAADNYGKRNVAVDGLVMDASYSSAWEYTLKARALIELLEIHNCGSVGGHDKDQGKTWMNRTLRQRYEWLVGKAQIGMGL